MPLFMIRRDVGDITQEDLDAAAYRAVTCSFHFEGMRWVRSYWDRDAGVVRCIYEADSAEDLLAHAARARIDCDDVREVTEVEPEAYTGESVQELART